MENRVEQANNELGISFKYNKRACRHLLKFRRIYIVLFCTIVYVLIMQSSPGTRLVLPMATIGLTLISLIVLIFIFLVAAVFLKKIKIPSVINTAYFSLFFVLSLGLYIIL